MKNDTPQLRKEINDKELERRGQRVILTCDHKQDRARQEFRNETNVNSVLKRHGVLPPSNKLPYYGELDYDVNLQQGLAALERERQAWSGLPIAIRSKYPTWELVANALAKKELQVKGGKLGFTPPPETPKPESGKTPDPASGKTPEKKD